MKLIKPAEISAKIMTLIDEAEKELIIVSPYNDITGWTKLTNRIKKAQSNGIVISWYTRKNHVDKKNSDEVRSIGIEPILIDDLHAKIYMNEEYAIFTSMNMSKVSDDKSIDLGYITTNKTEYDELYNTFLKHIKSKGYKNKNEEKPEPVSPKTSGNKPTLLHSKTSENNSKTQSLNSDEYYFRVIHDHICHNYGNYDYKYKIATVLEYFEFIKSSYTIQFMPFTQAIKVHILVPSEEIFDKIESRMNKSSYEFNKLFKKSEFEFCSEDDAVFVKYYFELYNRKVETWGMSEMDHFLKNLDITINLVYGNKLA